MRQIRAIFIILFLLVIFIIAVQNYETMSTPVTFRANFVFFNYETSGIPISFVAVVTFLVGVIVTGIFGMTERFRLKRQLKLFIKDAAAKDTELNSLRNLPVSSEDVGDIIEKQHTREEQ